MMIATEAKAGFDAQPANKNYDLLSKLYREIGISAVAAALEASKAPRHRNSQDNETDAVADQRLFESK